MFTFTAIPNISTRVLRTAWQSFSKVKLFSLLTLTRHANILPSPGVMSLQNFRRSTAHALLRTGSVWMSAPTASMISATCFSQAAPSTRPPRLNNSYTGDKINTIRQYKNTTTPSNINQATHNSAATLGLIMEFCFPQKMPLPIVIDLKLSLFMNGIVYVSSR